MGLFSLFKKGPATVITAGELRERLALDETEMQQALNAWHNEDCFSSGLALDEEAAKAVFAHCLTVMGACDSGCEPDQEETVEAPKDRLDMLIELHSVEQKNTPKVFRSFAKDLNLIADHSTLLDADAVTELGGMPAKLFFKGIMQEAGDKKIDLVVPLSVLYGLRQNCKHGDRKKSCAASAVLAEILRASKRGVLRFEGNFRDDPFDPDSLQKCYEALKANGPMILIIQNRQKAAEFSAALKGTGEKAAIRKLSSQGHLMLY